jgi:hypothetical protein
VGLAMPRLICGVIELESVGRTSSSRAQFVMLYKVSCVSLWFLEGLGFKTTNFELKFTGEGRAVKVCDERLEIFWD